MVVSSIPSADCITYNVQPTLSVVLPTDESSNISIGTKADAKNASNPRQLAGEVATKRQGNADLQGQRKPETWRESPRW